MICLFHKASTYMKDFDFNQLLIELLVNLQQGFEVHHPVLVSVSSFTQHQLDLHAALSCSYKK